MPADDKRELNTAARKMGLTGAAFLAIFAAMAIVGAILVIVGTALVHAIGLALLGLSLVPGMLAGALLVSGGISHRASQDKPIIGP